MGTYAPGTIANVTDADGTVRPMILTKDDLRHCWHGVRESGFLRCLDVTQAEDVRPLVVIDPEDREQVERVAGALRLHHGWSIYKNSNEDGVLGIERALRSLVTPPKPEEPTGAWAVVVDAADDQWVRVLDADFPDAWLRGGSLPGGTWTQYADIAAVRVLSDGVTA